MPEAGNQADESHGVGDEPGRQQQGAADEQHDALEQFGFGNFSPLQLFLHPCQGGKPLQAHQPDADGRGEYDETDCGDGAYHGAHLDENVHLEDGEDDKDE